MGSKQGAGGNLSPSEELQRCIVEWAPCPPGCLPGMGRGKAGLPRSPGWCGGPGRGPQASASPASACSQPWRLAGNSSVLVSDGVGSLEDQGQVELGGGEVEQLLSPLELLASPRRWREAHPLVPQPPGHQAEGGGCWLLSPLPVPPLQPGEPADLGRPHGPATLRQVLGEERWIPFSRTGGLAGRTARFSWGMEQGR